MYVDLNLVSIIINRHVNVELIYTAASLKLRTSVMSASSSKRALRSISSSDANVLRSTRKQSKRVKTKRSAALAAKDAVETNVDNEVVLQRR